MSHSRYPHAGSQALILALPRTSLLTPSCDKCYGFKGNCDHTPPLEKRFTGVQLAVRRKEAAWERKGDLMERS